MPLLVLLFHARLNRLPGELLLVSPKNLFRYKSVAVLADHIAAQTLLCQRDAWNLLVVLDFDI